MTKNLLTIEFLIEPKRWQSDGTFFCTKALQTCLFNIFILSGKPGEKLLHNSSYNFDEKLTSLAMVPLTQFDEAFNLIKLNQPNDTDVKTNFKIF